MSNKIITEIDALDGQLASASKTGASQSLVNGKRFSLQIIPDIQSSTPVNFNSPEKASLVDQGITYTAVTEGADGNDITITLVDPGTDGALAIDVTGTDIVVTLAYATGAITTDADELIAAINLDVDASALVDATGSGASPLTALAEDNLAGGVDSEVDVANSSITAAGFIQGGLVTLTTTGTLPDPLATGTDYYVIVPNPLQPNVIRLATSAALAEAGTYIELTDFGALGSVNTITADALAGLTVDLQVSNDNVNWSQIDTYPISVEGNFLMGELNPFVVSKYLRCVKTITGGAADVTANLIVIGDAI